MSLKEDEQRIESKSVFIEFAISTFYLLFLACGFFENVNLSFHLA